MGKPPKKVGKPKSRSKMSREKKKTNIGKASKQEKKFHRKVKFTVPLKKNVNIYQKNKSSGQRHEDKSMSQTNLDNDDDDGDEIEDEEMILPLDMLSDDEMQPVHMIADEEVEEDDENEHVESYERIPRFSFKGSKQERPLLPIKTDRGQLISQSVAIVDDEEVEEDHEEEETGEKQVATPPAKPVSMVELMVERQRKLDETKQMIVTLCDLIMKSPYEEISNLKHLRELLNLGDPLISMTIRKLTMLSLVELFRDIVPGYRIRSLKELTKDENEELKNTKHKKHTKKETLSKDVKVIRHFEQTLLKHYQFFLHFLEQCAKKNLPDNQSKTNKKLSSAKLNLGHLAIQCLCKLLSYLHQFNFRTNLINTVVQIHGE